MRRKGLLSLAIVSLALAGCGGDDGGDGADDASGQEEAARQVVSDTIAAYEARDFDAMCELQDQRVNESIPAVTDAKTCPEGYEKLFAHQKAFAGIGGSDQSFDDFVKQLGEYEVGDATISDEGDFAAEVALDGPIEGVRTFLVEEDGELKVSELFVTPDANIDPEGGTP